MNARHPRPYPFRIYSGLLIGALYTFLGVYVFFSPALFFFQTYPAYFQRIFAVLLTLYGAFRVYRALRERKQIINASKENETD